MTSRSCAPCSNHISIIRKDRVQTDRRIYAGHLQGSRRTRARSIAKRGDHPGRCRHAPDIIFGHNCWGEILHLKEVWPRVPLVPYFEFYYHDRGIDIDSNLEFPVFEKLRSTIRLRNAVNLLGLQIADLGQTPTKFQHGLNRRATTKRRRPGCSRRTARRRARNQGSASRSRRRNTSTRAPPSTASASATPTRPSSASSAPCSGGYSPIRCISTTNSASASKHCWPSAIMPRRPGSC